LQKNEAMKLEDVSHKRLMQRSRKQACINGDGIVQKNVHNAQ